MKPHLWMIVCGFGTLGVLSRYATNIFFANRFGSDFPIATFVINVIGSYLIGLVFFTETPAISPELRTAIMVGFLGGMTTFSSFCLESMVLLQNGSWPKAIGYMLLSPICGVIATLAGMMTSRYLIR